MKSKAEAKRSGTILRAVPKAEVPPPAPLSSLEREMATSPNEEVLNAIGRQMPLSTHQDFPMLPQNLPHSSRTFNVRTSKFSPTWNRWERNSPRSPKPDSTIGVWKDGHVRWESEPPIPLVLHASDAFADLDPRQTTPATKKNRRPRIQVIIPNDQRHRPFPSLLFFGNSNGAVKSATAEMVSPPDVSPPSGSKNTRVRTTIVSPLSTQMPKPIRPFALSSQRLEMIKQEPERPTSMHQQMPSLSNSSDDSQGEDDSFIYSKRSSMTSIEGDTDHSPAEIKPISLHSRSGSIAFPIMSPVKAGVFDNAVQSNSPSDHGVQDAEVCLHVPLSQFTAEPDRAPPPPPKDIKTYLPPGPLLSGRAVSSLLPLRRCPSGIRRRNSSRSDSHRENGPATRQDVLDRIISRNVSVMSLPSPTLSEAENDLKQHLTSITEDHHFKWDDVVSREQSQGDNFGPAPALPRKSSKRKSYVSPPNTPFPRIPSTHIACQMRRRGSKGACYSVSRQKSIKERGRCKHLTITIPNTKQITDDFTLSPISIPEGKSPERNITPQVAESVILNILESLESLDDLFATAVVNKGFYRVFKRHELTLMKRALHKMSPPAWEHREICPPECNELDPDTAQPRLEYTPTTYLQYYMRDMYIIAALKSLIIDQCQSFLRPETAAALASNDQLESSRVDDAFWRIWTFCKIFGCGKGREDDIMAQMDWLRGGVLVHQKACRSTMVTAASFDVSETFASAPECFAKGNEGGLSSEQLYDMTELWNCLGVLLQGFEGRTAQARECGVYDATDVRGGDIDGEEIVLEEWYHYLLTLGLSTILDLATPSRLPDASAFILASDNGWMDWKVPEHGGSRKTFLKEAISRVYEDKIARSFSSNAQKEMLRQLSKQRIQNHITEIRKRKTSGDYPEVRMSQERPISEWEDVFNRLTRKRSHQQAPPVPALSSPILRTATLKSQALRYPSLRFPPPTTPLPVIPRRDSTRVAPPQSPSLDNQPAFAQHPLQRRIYQTDVAQNSAEKAIYRIVEMGFTADQARHALRMTDMGDGLRVDRAVELLLRA